MKKKLLFATICITMLLVSCSKKMTTTSSVIVKMYEPTTLDNPAVVENVSSRLILNFGKTNHGNLNGYILKIYDVNNPVKMIQPDSKIVLSDSTIGIT
jgi:hypothetical protein